MALTGLLLATGCTMFEPEDFIEGSGGNPAEGGGPSMEIAPEFVGSEATLPPYSAGRLSSRSLIDAETTVSMKANFLRIDEDVAANDSGLYTYAVRDTESWEQYLETINWAESYLLEATLMSSPNKDFIRSVYLNPVQTYKMRVYTDEYDVTDTLDFYHSRMVSWYPMTCGDGEGTAPICKFGETYGEHMERFVEDGKGYVAVKFTGLDGQTDVMVSDVREGQHWHSPDSTPDQSHYQSNYAPEGHPTLAAGTKIYSAPFGSFEQDAILDSNGNYMQHAIDYDNHFTYKHYLSAVRVFAYADQSPQNLAMWGNLQNVTIANQPTSVKVVLPTTPGEFGEAYDWDDERDMEIATGKIFGAGDTNSELTEVANYPISFKGATSAAATYLGYALVRPDHDVEIMLHTSSGVYVVTVPHTYIDELGNEVSIFQASNIYDVRLNLKTNGTIAALLEKEEDKIYYDLTRLTVYDSPNSEGENFAVYRYSNTHIVSPDHTPAFDEDGNMIYEGGQPKYIEYDGYCFDATTIGNGQVGIISYGTQTLYPQTAHIEPKSARLLWESSLGLVTNVELMYGYVRFRVPEHSARGNAVIAVYDDKGTVLWSWHIWITDPPQEKTFDSGGSEIVMLDRNLGATKAEWSGAGDALDTYGLYYQWGRKDPSMGPESYNYGLVDLITKPYYDYSSRERTAAEVAQFPRPTLQNGVENPMFLIMPTARQQSYYFNWIYEQNDILWGYHESDGTMLKTIYDPCPYGYRVPLQSEMEMVFADAAPTRDTYGQIVNSTDGGGIYFPYAGYKGVDRDLQSLVLSWNYVGEKGDYMSSSISKDNASDIAGHPILNHRGRVYLTKVNAWAEVDNENDGYYYTTADTENKYRVLDYANRRTAASVRCVKNYDTGSIAVRVTPSQDWYMPGSEIKLVCEGVTTESVITSAELVVKSVDKGTTKTLYTTPAGKVEATQPIWGHEEVFIVGVLDGEFWSESYEITLTCHNSHGVKAEHKTTINFKDLKPITASITTDKTTAYNVASDVVTISYSASSLNGNLTSITIKENGTVLTTVTPTSTNSYSGTYSYAPSRTKTGERIFTIEVEDVEGVTTLSDESIKSATVVIEESPAQPITVSITPSTTGEIFYGAKTSGSISATASSPNGNLTSVVITHQDGTVVYSNNSVGSSSLTVNNIQNQTGFKGGEFVTYTITATDEMGMTASATTSEIGGVYKVTQRTALNQLTNGGLFLIENTNYTGRYLHNTTGNTISTTNTLSSTAFVMIEDEETVVFSTGNYLYMNAQRNSCNVSANGNSQTVDIAYNNNGFTFTKGYYNYRTYYLKQTGNTTVEASRNANGNYRWNIYEITLE